MLERGVLVICALAAHPVSKRTEIHQQESLKRFLFIGTPSLKFHKSLAREVSFSRSLRPGWSLPEPDTAASASTQDRKQPTSLQRKQSCGRVFDFSTSQASVSRD